MKEGVQYTFSPPTIFERKNKNIYSLNFHNYGQKQIRKRN